MEQFPVLSISAIFVDQLFPRYLLSRGKVSCSELQHSDLFQFLLLKSENNQLCRSAILHFILFIFLILIISLL